MKRIIFAMSLLVLSSAAFSQVEKKAERTTKPETNQVDQKETFKPTGKSDNVYHPNIGKRPNYNTYKLEITNSSGVVVFESTDPHAGWDGTYNGSVAPSGDYTWTVTYTESGSTKAHKAYGHVTVLK